jgi:hypothetical protein
MGLGAASSFATRRRLKANASGAGDQQPGNDPRAASVATSRMTINDLKDDRGVKPYAIDPDAAHRLWELSEKLTGTRGTP